MIPDKPGWYKHKLMKDSRWFEYRNGELGWWALSENRKEMYFVSIVYDDWNSAPKCIATDYLNLLENREYSDDMMSRPILKVKQPKPLFLLLGKT